MNTSSPIPSTQLVRALALAAHHGHEWASVLYGMTINVLSGGEVPWTPALIEAMVLAMRGEHSMAGISSPSFDQCDHIVHETGTGRLRWDIHPNGEVRLEVLRPSRLQSDVSRQGYHGVVVLEARV